MTERATLKPATARSMRDRCLFFLAQRLVRKVGRRYERALRPVGLRPSQLSVLAILRAAEPLTMTALARHAGVDTTTMTRVVQGLRARRLVQARHGADRRTVRIRLSPTGNRCLDLAYRVWCDVQGEMSRELPAGATERLRSLTRAFEALA
jgi:DNA-binding MarR family transcriptional regulator